MIKTSKWKYHPIAFMHDYEDEEASRFLDSWPFIEDIDRITKHLLQWDNGERFEYRDEPSKGNLDDWQEVLGGSYLLTWNKGLGYVGLESIELEGGS